MNRRRRTRALIPVAIVCLFLTQSNALSQSTPVPRYEVAVEFSSLGRDSFGGTRSEPGVGGRFTFNLNESVALEGAGYVFPRRCFDCFVAGRMTQAVAGVKAGKRFDSWGVFAKVRPGIVNFSEGVNNPIFIGPPFTFPIIVERKAVTSFATDIGGVVEFYPSPKIVTRFDVGDTIIHFTRKTRNAVIFDPATNMARLVPVPIPARTEHRFQFNASVGFRF